MNQPIKKAEELLKSLKEPVVSNTSTVSEVTGDALKTFLAETGISRDSYSLRKGEVITITKNPQVRRIDTTIEGKEVSYVVLSAASLLDGRKSARWISISALFRNYWDVKEGAYVRIGSDLVKDLASCSNNEERFNMLLDKTIACDGVLRIENKNDVTGITTRTMIPVVRYGDEPEMVLTPVE